MVYDCRLFSSGIAGCPRRSPRRPLLVDRRRVSANAVAVADRCEWASVYFFQSAEPFPGISSISDRE